jgi:hypothetical protein
MLRYAHMRHHARHMHVAQGIVAPSQWGQSHHQPLGS